jgi:hypothetical protein
VPGLRRVLGRRRLASVNVASYAVAVGLEGQLAHASPSRWSELDREHLDRVLACAGNLTPPRFPPLS